MIDLEKIKLFVFDLDGTLLDSIDDLVDSLNLALIDTKLAPVDISILKTKLCLGSDNLLAELVGEEIDLIPTVYENYVKRYKENMLRNSPLYDGVTPLLSALATTHDMAILTNKREEPSHIILQHYDIHHYFEVIVGGDTLSEKKPSPLPLLHICEQLSIAPSETLMVGDSHADVIAGKKAGAQTMAVLNGFTTSDMLMPAKPDVVLSNIGELTDFVTR